MYRASGIEIGRLNYSLDPTSQKTDRLPLRLWAARTLKSEWSSKSAGIVDSRLALDEGFLTGTLTHRLKDSIESWILVHGNKVYSVKVPESGAIEPGSAFTLSRETLRRDGVQQVLNARKITYKDKKKQTIVLEQTAYDPNHRDADALLRMLTFHEAAGGRKYTGLDNFPLERLDLSRLLPLNRAVLLGRIKSPAAEVALGDEGTSEPQTVAPTQTHTFVRIVLPVQSQVDSR